MTRNDDALSQLRQALSAAPGRETVARRLAGVRDLILEARGRGVEWSAIAQHLAAAGIARPDGRPLAVSSISHAVHRTDRPPQPKRAEPRTAAGAAPRPPAPHSTAGAGFRVPELEALLAAPAAPPPEQTIDHFLMGKK